MTDEELLNLIKKYADEWAAEAESSALDRVASASRYAERAADAFNRIKNELERRHKE